MSIRATGAKDFCKVGMWPWAQAAYDDAQGLQPKEIRDIIAVRSCRRCKMWALVPIPPDLDPAPRGRISWHRPLRLWRHGSVWLGRSQIGRPVKVWHNAATRRATMRGVRVNVMRDGSL